jgi:hypothetical protein
MERPLIVFHVNETLLDLQHVTPILGRIFGDEGVMQLYVSSGAMRTIADRPGPAPGGRRCRQANFGPRPRRCSANNSSSVDRRKPAVGFDLNALRRRTGRARLDGAGRHRSEHTQSQWDDRSASMIALPFIVRDVSLTREAVAFSWFASGP